MMIKRMIYIILVCVLVQILASFESASNQNGKTIITFDEIDAERNRVAADKYLLDKFHISISDVTPGTQVFIVSANKIYGGRSLQSSSGNNMLTQGDSLDPVSFTLNLPKPVQVVSFTRPKLIAGVNGITFPEWTAQALDAKHNPLGEPVGEPLGAGEKYFHDVPAETFTLRGPNIKAVRFWSNNHHFAAFSAVHIDDLTLETTTHP